MRKWKKLLLPAMCAFMLQIPVIVNAEAVDSSNNVTSAVETPVATPTPALLDGIVKKGSRTYFYKNCVMQKNCWSPGKYMADGAVLRKLLGRPSKTKTLSSCMTGISKDLKLTYANIFVQLGKKTTGGEIVYGVQAR